MIRKFMYSILCIIIISSSLYIQLSAQEEGEIIIIREKLGEEINLDERNKYNLFRGIKTFQSAVLYKYHDGCYDWKVTYLDETAGEGNSKLISQTESETTYNREDMEKPSELKATYCFNLGLGTLINGDARLGMISIGVYKYIGFEVSMVTAPEATVISGNLGININNNMRFNPFWTIGLGTISGEILLLNFGGGIRIRLIENLGFQTEYRHWLGPAINVGSIFGGIFICF